MKNTVSKRDSRGETVLACRTLPIPIFALYGLGAAGITWMIAAWRDRRQRERLRNKIKTQQGNGEEEEETR